MKFLFEIHCASVKYIALSCTITLKKSFLVSQNKAFKHSDCLLTMQTTCTQTRMCHVFSFHFKSHLPFHNNWQSTKSWNLDGKSQKDDLPWAELHWKLRFHYYGLKTRIIYHSRYFHPFILTFASVADALVQPKTLTHPRRQLAVENSRYRPPPLIPGHC